MLIGEKYKVESDSLNVTLYEKRKTKKGGILWRPVSYFANSHNLLKHLVDLEVRETEMKDLNTITKKQDELYTLINTLKGLPERLQSVRDTRKGLT